MHRLITVEDLLNQQHTLALYCAACDRWAVADLDSLIIAGLGHRQITRTQFRCADCGSLAEKQLRPPVPRIGDAVPWTGPGSVGATRVPA